ncbi:MAG: hypothetical protein KDD46_08910, partial [Bdellovibrionales bacterium]|nr:hypothetical protein [Bdellovibrionales bacterium]
RVAQLFGLYPHIKAVPMRGNLQTRLEKMKEQELAGIILAASGMIRMGYIDQIQDYISLDHFVPAVGQGYLGITGRKEDSFEFLSNWQDALVWTKMTALRTMLVQLEGGCSVPFGAAWNGDHLNVFLSDLAGEKKIQKKIPFHESHQKTVDQMLNELYAEGAKDIIERIRSGR